MYLKHDFLIAPERPAAETLRVPVLKIFDGDGFSTKLSLHPGVEIEASVRFGFIDAPEIAQPGGPEARDFLRFLIGGKSVDIAILTKTDTGKSVDRYRRVVCIPYLYEDDPNAAESKSSFWTTMFGTRQPLARNIELEMVLNGWAWVLDRYGPDDRYFDAFEDARRARRGIWAYDDNLHPWEFKKQKHQSRKATPARPIKKLVQLTETPSACCQRYGCGGYLAPRKGKFGRFFGCTNFPKCKHTSNQ